MRPDNRSNRRSVEAPHRKTGEQCQATRGTRPEKAQIGRNEQAERTEQSK